MISELRRGGISMISELKREVFNRGSIECCDDELLYTFYPLDFQKINVI